MKRIFLVAAMASTSLAFGQHYTISDISDQNSDGETLSFPLVASSDRPDVAYKMNKALQQQVLGMGTVMKTARMFDALRDDDATLTYEVTANNARFLAFQFQKVECGMRCMPEVTYIILAAADAQPVSVDQLFTATGYHQLMTEIQKEWRERTVSRQDDADHSEEYKDCLDTNGEDEEFQPLGYTLNDSSVIVYGTGCLDATDWQYPDDTRGPYTRSFENMWSKLTPYGVSLFTGAPQTPASFSGKVLHGMIDSKYPLTVLLLAGEGTKAGILRGVELYDKYGQNIRLVGTVDGNHVIYQEMEDSGMAGAKIDAIWTSPRLKGTFTNLKSGKSMPFDVGM